MNYADRVRELTATQGVGAFALGGPVVGFRAFAAVLAIGATCFYAAEALGPTGAPRAEWEVGIGTYVAPNTLERTNILSSSNGAAPVAFGAGVKQVWIDAPASAFAQFLGRDEAAAAYETQAHAAATYETQAHAVATYVTKVFATATYLPIGATAADSNKLQGATWGSPPAIGNVAPGTGAFTNVFSPRMETLAGGIILAPFNGVINFGSTGAAGMRSSVVLALASNASMQWTNAANNFFSSAVDLIVLRDAAGTLAQRNGVNPQTFNVYKTFTDAANYERGGLRWVGNILEVFTQGAGTGAQRPLAVNAMGVLPPKLTTVQRDAIAAPDVGLVVFNTTTNKLNVRGAAGWEQVQTVAA